MTLIPLMKKLLAYVGYDSNYINGNIHVTHESGPKMEIPNVDEYHVTEMHLKNLWK
jgi:hypothetical protein